MSAPPRVARHGDLEIAYEVRGGSGPYLVMVHGLGYGRWGWGRFADLLALERRVVLVDNRGVGDSSGPPGPYSVAEMATDIEAVIDDLGSEGCDVLGASLGGMVVLEMLLAARRQVGRVVLLAATPGPELGRPLPEATVRLLSGEVAETADTARRLVSGALSPTTARNDPGLVDRLLELRAAHPQERSLWRAQAEASLGFAPTASLAGVTNPVLAIAGSDDLVIDPANTELLSELLPDARAMVLPGLGHMSFWEDPERIAEAVARFLDGNEGPVVPAAGGAG